MIEQAYNKASQRKTLGSNEKHWGQVFPYRISYTSKLIWKYMISKDLINIRQPRPTTVVAVRTTMKVPTPLIGGCHATLLRNRLTLLDIARTNQNHVQAARAMRAVFDRLLDISSFRRPGNEINGSRNLCKRPPHFIPGVLHSRQQVIGPQ